MSNLILIVGFEKPEYYFNDDLVSIQTPIDWKELQHQLVESNYPDHKTIKLVQGFKKGFDLGYSGPVIRQSQSHNLPFNVGNKTILWNKLMKEVRLKRVAGPFADVP